MNYYAKSAFTQSQKGTYNQPLSPTLQMGCDDIKQIDLRKFPVCEEYLAVGRTLVEPSQEELEQQKWRGNHIEEKKRRQNLHRHYYYNQSNAVILLKTWSIVLRYGAWFVFFGFIVLNLVRAISSLDLSRLWFTSDRWMIVALLYIPGVILKHIESRLSHKEGATFNRQTGKVHYYQNGIERIFDFKDFIPFAKRKTSYKSNPYYSSSVQRLIKGGDVYICTIPNGSIAAGVIEYHFLKHYMDISRPLPDVPELECYRQYDPVTKAHDEKTGRDPHYWRHMPPAKLNRLIKQSRERAWATLGKDTFHAMYIHPSN